MLTHYEYRISFEAIGGVFSSASGVCWTNESFAVGPRYFGRRASAHQPIGPRRCGVRSFIGARLRSPPVETKAIAICSALLFIAVSYQLG